MQKRDTDRPQVVAFNAVHRGDHMQKCESEENQTRLNIQTGKTPHIPTQTRFEANICINIRVRYIIYISKAVCAPTALTAQICGVLLAHWSDSRHLSQSQSEQEVRFSIPQTKKKKTDKTPKQLEVWPAPSLIFVSRTQSYHSKKRNIWNYENAAAPEVSPTWSCSY